MGATIIYRAKIAKESKQPERTESDVIPRPFDAYDGDLIDYYTRSTSWNSYHCKCLSVMASCAVGLGFDVVSGNESEVDRITGEVNELGQSMMDVIKRVLLDHLTCGQGYLEVARSPGGFVSGLYYCPAGLVYRRRKGSSSPFLYTGENGTEIPFGRFTETTKDANTLLDFVNYTQLDRHYGLPDWRGCIPDIELDRSCVLYNQRFFDNSGIPDLAIVVEGGQFDEETEKKVVEFCQTNLKGVENAHRTLYLPINQEGVTVKFEKLGMDTKKDGSFEALRSRCRDNIISAHGVPPRLVGIMSAGQLGGGGEVEGQLKTFKELTIAPIQGVYETRINMLLRLMGVKAEIKLRQMDISTNEADSVYYPKMVDSKIITRNEAREDLGWPQLSDKELGVGEPPDVKEDDKDTDKTGAKVVRQLELIRKSL